MRLLELFCGTKSVGKAVGHLFDEVVSVDLEKKFNPSICGDILALDYKDLWKPGEFDVIWASPPCCTFSTLRNSHINTFSKTLGRKRTREDNQNDIDTIGLPILRRTQEIIEYLKPKLWFIENPQTGRMKEYIDPSVHFADTEYCAYGYPYRKKTRFWSNNTNVKDLKRCPHGRTKHEMNIGNGFVCRREQMYSIPRDLIIDLFARGDFL